MQTWISGLHNCLKFTHPSSCLDEAMLTREMSYCFCKTFLKSNSTNEDKAGKAVWLFFLLPCFLTLKITYESSESFEVFPNCARKHRDSAITTMFTYSHLNTNQKKENANTILIIFIKKNIAFFPWKYFLYCKIRERTVWVYILCSLNKLYSSWLIHNNSLLPCLSVYEYEISSCNLFMRGGVLNL